MPRGAIAMTSCIQRRVDDTSRPSLRVRVTGDKRVMCGSWRRQPESGREETQRCG
jgi:hypothetical protein